MPIFLKLIGIYVSLIWMYISLCTRFIPYLAKLLYLLKYLCFMYLPRIPYSELNFSLLYRSIQTRVVHLQWSSCTISNKMSWRDFRFLNCPLISCEVQMCFLLHIYFLILLKIYLNYKFQVGENGLLQETQLIKLLDETVTNQQDRMDISHDVHTCFQKMNSGNF